MRIRISDAALLPDLIEFLVARDALVAELNPTDLEAGLVGSYNSIGLRVELEDRLRLWQERWQQQGRIVAFEILNPEPPQPLDEAG